MFSSVTSWISKLLVGDNVGAGMGILALAVTIGLLLGSIRIRGIRLGVSGVLFSALVFGQLGLTIDPVVLGFLRDFALVTFMYAIGLQVGPAFVSSFRSEGLRLNVLAVAVIILGAAMAVIEPKSATKGTAAGIFTGAFTSTPGLGAAQEAALRASGVETQKATAHMGLAYSITYPFGVVGPMLVIPLLRRILGVGLIDEKLDLIRREEKRRPPIQQIDFEVTQMKYTGKPLKEIPQISDRGIVLSRLFRDNVVSVPNADTIVQLGDIYRAVGPRESIAEMASLVGHQATVDLAEMKGDVERKDLLVTRAHVLRRQLHELDLVNRTGVTIGRINRAGIDLIPKGSLRLAFGDRVTAVGPAAGLKLVEAELGNCADTLNRPQLVPIFLGIVLGVLVGSIPIMLPGIHATLRIGLAGGPLLAAIALSQLGNIGSIVWYMPSSANQLFRDFGLAVFLACVGFSAGDHFIQRAANIQAFWLLGWGAAITVVPVFIVAIFAKKVMRMNFITITGLVAGAMTSSTTLIFADDFTQSDAPSIAYAAVAPLATLVPILCAQLLAIKAL
jgi:putative transport protein